MEKEIVYAYSAVIVIMVVVFGFAFLIVSTGNERYRFCDEMGYDDPDGYPRQVSGERWIKCEKVVIENNTLIEIVDWVRWPE